MTLEEMKIKVYTLIEEYDEEEDEYTADEDLYNKFNTVANIIQNELARLKKISTYKKIEASEGDIIEFKDIDDNFYQLQTVKGVNVDIIGNRIKFNKDGELEIYYYKYPEQITNETEDDYEFELSTDVLEVAVIGIAGLLLASDVSQNYGQIYTNKYESMKQQLDSRYNLGQVFIDEGSEAL